MACGGRRCLSFGYSSEDIEVALKDVEDIENELLAEIYGIDFNYEDDLFGMQKNVVCPMCQVDRLEDRLASGMIRCRGKICANDDSDFSSFLLTLAVCNVDLQT